MILIENIRSIAKNKNKNRSSTELIDDVLCIDCRCCRKVPDVKTIECMRCMVANISEYGNAGRIRLRTSRDLELSGPAAEMMCELAMLCRSTMPFSINDSRSCNDCNNSCGRVMEIIWSGFPDPNFDSARGRLTSFRPSKGECNTCIQRTYRALDQTELGFNNLRKKISMEIARNGGV